MNPLTLAQFEERVRTFPWKGQITEFHVHHTADFKRTWQGYASIASIREAHLKRNFREGAAQHVLLDPTGMIWLGRNWNLYPASTNAPGRNGKDNGPRPFMVEVFANFAHGDKLEGPQAQVLPRMIRAVQKRFGLPADSLVFHKEMEPTLCPGNIDKAALVAGVQALDTVPVPAELSLVEKVRKWLGWDKTL